MLTAAQSLLAELHLRRGSPEEACTASTAAVQRLEASAHLALVRTEEVLWRHGRCLAAAGRDGADEYLEKARAEVRRKAESLERAEDRRRLLEVTPVARALEMAGA
jgi:hypothetical protein